MKVINFYAYETIMSLLKDMVFKHRVIEMIVGVLTTCHTKYT